MGREVRSLVNKTVSAGYHSTLWNATNDLGAPVSAGVYIYTISANEYRDVKKMILLK
jgi:flagellar hook assembly protein FlgD